MRKVRVKKLKKIWKSLPEHIALSWRNFKREYKKHRGAQ